MTPRNLRKDLFSDSRRGLPGRRVSSLILLGALSAPLNATGLDFEEGGSGVSPPLWVELGGVVQAAPEGAGGGGPGQRSARLTDGDGLPLLDGARGAGLITRIRLPADQPALQRSWLRFDYSYDEHSRLIDSHAFVLLHNDSGTHRVDLQDTGNQARTVQVAVAGDGPLTVAVCAVDGTDFDIWRLGFLLDDVEAKVDQQGWPGPDELEALPYDLDQVASDADEDLILQLQQEMGAFQDLGMGMAGADGITPRLIGSGNLEPGSSVEFTVLDARRGVLGLLILGNRTIELPFRGGTLVPAPELVRTILIDQGAIWKMSASWPATLPAGTEIFVQVWLPIPEFPEEESASNALWGISR